MEHQERSIPSCRVAQGKQPGQPAASNMRELVWDAELETIAQRCPHHSPSMSINVQLH
jgi:hypothetical protein